MPKKKAKKIVRLPSGTYRARIQVHGTRHSATFNHPEDAEKWVDRMKAGKDGSLGLEPLRTWFATWIDGAAERVQPVTLSGYNQTFKTHILPYLGHISMLRLQTNDITQWQAVMRKKGDSAYTRAKSLVVLKTCLREAVRMELIRVSPAEMVRAPRKEKKSVARALDGAELRRLLKAAEGDRYEHMLHLAVDTGMRPAELFALRWANVDLGTRTVTVSESLENLGGRKRVKETKTGGIRRITISENTARLLKVHRTAVNGIIWRTCEGEAQHKSNLRARWWVPLCKKAGLPGLRLYDLRHTCATLLLSGGVPVKVVSDRLGHSDVLTTLRHYGHVIPAMQETAAAEMNRILDMATKKNPVDEEPDTDQL